MRILPLKNHSVGKPVFVFFLLIASRMIRLRSCLCCALGGIYLLAGVCYANSLLLHYSFDGASIDDDMLAADRSGNGYDATVTGLPRASGDVPISMAGGEAWKGSRGDWMDPNVVDDAVLAPVNYTIAFWAKPTSHASTVIASSRSVDFPATGTAVFTRGNGGFRFYHNGSQVISDAEAGVVFDLDKWTHVTVTVDTVNDSVVLYVDGVLRHSESTSLAPMTQGLARIGSSKADLGSTPRNPHGDTYQGLLDDFRFYDYPLTAAEVKALAGLPLLHFSFDGAVADHRALATDRSVHGYDALISGSPAGASEVSEFVGSGSSWQGTRGDWMDLSVADPSILAPANYTLAFWAKPSIDASSVIASSHGTVVSAAPTALLQESEGGLRFFHNGRELISGAEAGVVFDTTKWTHVVITVDTVNDTLALYVDGDLRHTERRAMSPMIESLARIGSSKSDSITTTRDPLDDTFRGWLDEFYFYDYAITPVQVQALTGMTTYVMYPPNGNTIPRILGANSSMACATGFDYIQWFGISHIRIWYKYTGFSSLPDDASVTTAELFDQAVSNVRADPLRQASATDHYIDWAEFERLLVKYNVDEQLEAAKERQIGIMISNDELTTVPGTNPNTFINITGDWVKTFTYWKSWYSLVYYMASRYDVEMYQFDNEPYTTYDGWESHWLVASDAMRKAIKDVNRDYQKNLTLQIVGPTTAGAWWDYQYPDPDDNSRGWGSVSWGKVKYDMHGNYDVNNPWNYGMYDYHRYSSSASRFEDELMGLRYGIAHARNDPSSDIPIVITEMNTHTGAGFRADANDTEDLFHGVAIAQLLEVTGSLGQDGLGADGGFFVFKLAGGEWQDPPLTGIENRFAYVSRAAPNNQGGITRGGATFQMYSKHFRGGKEIVPYAVVNGGSREKHRVIAALDAEKDQYYIYGSNVSGADDTVVYDLSNLDPHIVGGTPITLQRVDADNTGQITDIIELDASRKLIFRVPDLSAYLFTVPKGHSTSEESVVKPTEDTTQNVLGDEDLEGRNANLLVSLHHSDATQRRVALLRFNVSNADTMSRALLNLSGRNAGLDSSEREILHVYAVSDADWSESTSMPWTSAPGVGSYMTDLSLTPKPAWAAASGEGPMIDIEDNYGGVDANRAHTGSGLGIHGEFVGAISFASADYTTNYLDVTDYIKSVSAGSVADVTFVVVRIVRYDVNDYDNEFSYEQGVYHYDGRLVEIASKENKTNARLHPALVLTSPAVRDR